MAGIWLNTDEGGLSPCHWEDGCDLVFQIGKGNLVFVTIKVISATKNLKNGGVSRY